MQNIVNRNLFSNHYLEDILPKSKEWSDKAYAEVCQQIKKIYRREEAFLSVYNESQLEDRFIRPILKALGYEFAVQAKVKNGQDFPDYALYKDINDQDNSVGEKGRKSFYDRAIAVAEVKKWGTELDIFGRDKHNKRRNPSFQIWLYLQETKPNWGILTNGRKWRLYRKDQPFDTYFEIDLADILEKDDTTNFRFFYYFFRKDAIAEIGGQVFLEHILHGSIDYAEKVGDSLKENVYKSLRLLAQGFFDRSENHLDSANERHLDLVQRSGMRLLYRLLFVLYAEGKGLLNDEGYLKSDYSLYKIRHEMAERIDNHYSFILAGTQYWGKLKDLFALINLGSEAVGIPKEQFFVPPYNGGLFDLTNDALAIDKSIGDSAVSKVIDLLARTQNTEGQAAFVDYSTLDVRHLGSIYEGLLEFKLKRAEERMVATKENDATLWMPFSKYLETAKRPKAFGEFPTESRADVGEVYLATDKGERKVTGSYYTPEFVVKYIVDNTLEPIVREKWEEAIGNGKSLAEATLSIRVLDPAMGSGHFLVSATLFLSSKLMQAIESDIEAGLIPESMAEKYTSDWAKREVVTRCIYGVDLNDLAVELAKVSLWLSTISKEKPLSFMDHHLKCGNSLIGSNVIDLPWLPNRRSSGSTASVDKTTGFIGGLIDLLDELKNLPENSVADVKEKERIFEKFKVNEGYLRVKSVADVHTGLGFSKILNDDIKNPYMNLVNEAYYGSIKEWKSRFNSGWVKKYSSLSEQNHAFHWELEFPDVFFGNTTNRDESGFDVVIGNPPYVIFKQFSDVLREYYRLNCRTYQMKGDVYVLFIEKCTTLVRKGGCVGLIVQNKFLMAAYGAKLRNLLVNRTTINEIVNFNDSPVFEISAYPLIVLLKNEEPTETNKLLWAEIEQKTIEDTALALNVRINRVEVEQKSLKSGIWKQEKSSIQKRNVLYISDLAKQIGRGAAPGNTDVYLVDGATIEKFNLERKYLKLVVRGGDIGSFNINSPREPSYIIYPYDKDIKVVPETFIPNIITYLAEHREELLTRKNYGKFLFDQGYVWYELTYPSPGMLNQKIMFPDISNSNKFAFDKDGIIGCMDTVYYIVRNREYSDYSTYFIISILNSKHLNHIFKMMSPRIRGGYLRYKSQYVKELPIPEIIFKTSAEGRKVQKERLVTGYEEWVKDENNSNNNILKQLSSSEVSKDVIHDILTHLGERMESMLSELNGLRNMFLEWLESPMVLNTKVSHLKNKTKISGLFDSPFLNTDEGLTEIIRVFADNRIRLSASQLNGLKDEYLIISKSAISLKNKLRKTEIVIDMLVYRLFGLTVEEIATEENVSVEEIRKKYGI